MDKICTGPSKSAVRKALMLEPLEERIAPSGGIVVTVSGGSLKIMGDAEDNDFVIEARLAPGEYSIVSGDDATLINGQAGPLVVSGVTRDISIKLNDGDDRVEFDGVTIPRNVLIDAGKGDDAVEISSSSIAGKVGIKMGDGNENIGIANSTIGGNLAIDHGKDGGTTYIGASTIGGKVDIKGSTGDDSVHLDVVTVNQGLSIITGAGDLSVTINGVDENSPTTIGNTGRGYDLKIANGNGNCSFSLLDGVAVGKNFSYAQGTGTLTGDISLAWIMGNTQIKSGTGNDAITIETTDLDGKRSIMTGSGDLSLYMDNVGVSDDVHRGYDTKITNGNGVGDIEINNCGFTGSLSISNGNGNAGVEVEDVTVNKNYSYKSGSGDDTFRLLWATVKGKTSVNTGSGADNIIFDAVALEGALSVNTGSGNDMVYLDAEYDLWADTSVFAGPVSIILGSGDDYLGVGVGTGVDGGEYYSRVFANGGSGWDELDYETGNNYFAVEPNGVGFENIH